jgi:hypothetical protein
MNKERVQKKPTMNRIHNYPAECYHISSLLNNVQASRSVGKPQNYSRQNLGLRKVAQGETKPWTPFRTI